MLIELGTAAGVWVWDTFSKEIIDKASDIAKTQWEKFNWAESAEKYRRALARDCDKVRLLGTHEVVELEGIFTDLYILDKVSAFQRHAIADLHEEPNKLNTRQRVNGLELVKTGTYSHLFILGKPGAGKTTFLKYVTLQALKGQLDKVPIFISLHQWANFVRKSANKQFDLMPFLVEQFKLCAFPHAQTFIEHLLDNGKTLLLFDGLDEVNQADDERARTLQALADFSRQYRNCMVLLTCRVAAADYSVTEQFQYLEVADFTKEQITIFVQKWFKTDAERGEKFLADFAKPEHRGLRELAQIPILLTLLCLIYQRKMEFPLRRADIYEEAIDALLDTWDSKYRSIKRDVIYQGLSKRRKQQLFSRIAAETFENKQYFIEKKFLAEKIASFLRQLPNSSTPEIDGEAVLEAIAAQHGIFVERAKDIYSFAHLSFQEYFTAKYIVENQAYGSIDKLVLQVGEDRWREVFLLTASLLDNADNFFNAMQGQINSLIIDEKQSVSLLQQTNNKIVHFIDNVPSTRALYCLIELIFNHRQDPSCLSSPKGKGVMLRTHTRTHIIDTISSIDPDLTRLLEFVDQLNGMYLFVGGEDGFEDESEVASEKEVHEDDIFQVTTNAADVFQQAMMNNEVSANLNFNYINKLLQEDLSHYSLNIKMDLKMTFIWQFAMIFAEASPKLFRIICDKKMGDYLLFFNELVQQVKSENLTELQEQLVLLAMPNQKSSQAEWKNFAIELKTLLQNNRNIAHDWNFTYEEIKNLANYFSANTLLIKCLKLATVSNREAIKNNLLLPPASAQVVNQTQPFITAFQVKHFKSLVDVKLELGQINVFIGANGSGKSNLLEALAMLSAAQENRLDPDMLYDKGIRIAKPSLMYSAFKEQTGHHQVEIAVELDNDPLPIKTNLTAKQGDNVIFHWEVSKIGLDVEQIERLKRQFTYPPLNEYVIYNLETRTLRGLTSESKKQPLGINGEGLDNLLLNFSPTEREELEKYSYLIEWLDEVVLDEADNYKREGLKQGRSVSKLYFKDRFMSVDNNVFSAENSNEGILHVLFYLALFISRQTPQLFAIDNIESSLNPHLCRHLIEQLCELAKTNRKQALITTHNPAILDGLNLNDDAIRLFIVNRDDETGKTQIERLQAKPRPDNERKHIKLSELWMKGYIGAIPEDF